MTLDINHIALVFEESERGNVLVERDFDLARMNATNSRGEVVAVDGCFMPKHVGEAGLEVADLIAHTAGRQRRHQLRTSTFEAKPDFQHLFWHSPIPPYFMSIDMVTVEGLDPRDELDGSA